MLRPTSMSLYISAIFQRMPWKLADRAAERLALLGVAHRLFERALGEAQRDAGVEAALRVEGRQQFPEAVLAQHQILGRQNAILEADLVQVFAAHRVVGAGDRKAGGAPLDQDAADPLAAGPPVDPGEDDEHLRLVGAADQGLDAVELEGIAGRCRHWSCNWRRRCRRRARSCRSPGWRRRCTPPAECAP